MGRKYRQILHESLIDGDLLTDRLGLPNRQQNILYLTRHDS
jgi:hypothetical protein